MNRILIMYSWDDEISQRRLAGQRKSPLLADYTFQHCFALEHESDEPREEAILARASGALEEFQPEVLLLHTGAAFNRNPEVFFRVADQIKEQYPNLRLGLERRRGRWGGEAFEDSEAMQELEGLFFPGY